MMERDAKKCGDAGFDAFLGKPIRRENLFRMLERLLGKNTGAEAANVLKQHKILTQYSVREEMKRAVRILLAEDNPVNQKLAKIMLTKAGYRVEVADNGKKAIESFMAAPDAFDLIFMDIQMPEMDGLEATRRIRALEIDAQRSKLNASGALLTAERRPPTAGIPIVAMTAHAMKGDRGTCIAAGMNDYITKPIKRERVFKIVEKWVFDRRP